jgi:hypothetical protein
VLSELGVPLLFLVNLFGRVVGVAAELFELQGAFEQVVVGRVVQNQLPVAFGAVALFEGARAFESVVGGVGDARAERSEVGDADERVAAADAVIQKGERLAAVVSFHPEGEFAQFDGEWVAVDAVDAVGNHLAQGASEVFGGCVLVAGAGEVVGELARGCQQEVPAAAGGIQHANRQNRPLPLVGRACGSEPLVDNGLQRVLHQLRHEVGRGVERASRAPFAA